MSSNGDENSDVDAKPFSSPSAYLQAPSSSQEPVEDVKTTQSQLIASTGEDDHVSSDDGEFSDDVRENRFSGPARTWQRYTEEERTLAASLNQQQANDLSVHLYNAHTLKSRLYDGDLAARAKPWQSKQSWMLPEDNGNIPWHPDQNWTAWPLPPSEVPRQAEAFGKPLSDDGFDDETWQKPMSWKASGDLEDEIKAVMLRNAKQQFHRRAWANSKATELARPGHARLRSLSRSRSRRQSSASSSQPDNVTAEESVVDGTTTIETTPSTEPPVLMADDEEASRLLKPSACHVLSRLDDLLMALHHNRQGHHASAMAQSTGEAEDNIHKRKRRSTTDDAAEAAPSLNRSEQKAVKRAKIVDGDYAKSASRPHAVRTRDWSEVLGVASLAGWDPAIVERAAKRCTALFGETMSFRTMPEKAVDATTDFLVEYRPDTIRDIDFVSDEESTEDESTETDGFRCPEQSCPRRLEPYERRWRLHEHLRKRHRYNREDIEEFAKAFVTTERPPDSRTNFEQSEEDDHDHASFQSDTTKAVHEDGFMQPISIKLHRGRDAKPRSRKGSRVPDEALDRTNGV